MLMCRASHVQIRTVDTQLYRRVKVPEKALHKQGLRRETLYLDSHCGVELKMTAAANWTGRSALVLHIVQR